MSEKGSAFDKDYNVIYSILLSPLRLLLHTFQSNTYPIECQEIWCDLLTSFYRISTLQTGQMETSLEEFCSRIITLISPTGNESQESILTSKIGFVSNFTYSH